MISQWGFLHIFPVLQGMLSVSSQCDIVIYAKKYVFTTVLGPELLSPYNFLYESLRGIFCYVFSQFLK